MISFVRGKVFTTAQGCVDIDVHGVGYRLWVPERVALQLNPGEDTLLYTHQHIREDTQDLYGFVDEVDRDWFELMLNVSGIGPKGALQIVSASDYHQFVSAVSGEDSSYLTKLPGVGKKTAQRMILDLKDKVDAVNSVLSPNYKMPASTAVAVGDPLAEDLVEALKSLGYNERQAAETTVAVLQSEQDLTLEAALTKCLQRMDR